MLAPTPSPAPAFAVVQAPPVQASAHDQASPTTHAAAATLAVPTDLGSSPAPVATAGPADPSLKRKRMPPSVPPSPQAPRSPRAKRMTLEPSATPPSPPQVVEEPPAAVSTSVDARDASQRLPAVVGSSPATAAVGNVLPVHVTPPPAFVGGYVDAAQADQHEEVTDVAMAEMSAATAEKIHANPPVAAVIESTQASHSSDLSTGMVAPPTDPAPSDRESTAAGITSAVMDMDLDASSMGHFTVGGPAYPSGTTAAAAAYVVDYRDSDVAMEDMYMAGASATFTLYSAAAAAAAAAAAQEERGLGSPRLHQFDHAPQHGTPRPSSSGAQLYLTQPPATAPAVHHAHPPPPLPRPSSHAHAAHFRTHPVSAPAPATGAAADRSFQLYAAKYHHHDDPIGYEPAHLVRAAAPPPPPPLPVQQHALHVHPHHYHGGHGNVPTSLPPHLLQPPVGAAAYAFHAPQHLHHHSHHHHHPHQQQQHVGHSPQGAQYTVTAAAPGVHARTASRGSRGHVSAGVTRAVVTAPTAVPPQQRQQQQHHFTTHLQRQGYQQQHAQHHQQYAQLQQQQQLAAQQHFHQYQQPQPQAFQTAQQQQQQQQPYPRAALLQQQQYHAPPPPSQQRYAVDSAAAAAPFGKSSLAATAAAVSMPHDVVDGAAAAMPFLIQEMFHAAGMTALAAAGCDPQPTASHPPATTTWATTAPAAGTRSSHSSNSTSASLLATAAPTTTTSAPAPYPEYDYFIQDQPGDTTGGGGGANAMSARDMHDLHDLIAAAAATGTSPVTASPMALLTAPAALDPTLGLDDGAFRHALAFPPAMGGGKQHEAREMPVWHAPPVANRTRRAATVAGPVTAASDMHAAGYYATMAAMAELVAAPAPTQAQRVPAGVGMGGSRPSTVAAITALQAYMMAPQGSEHRLSAEAAGSVPKAPAM
ncbi:hypothetical protein AMAG_18492 [Allomyces macrogynus ATCC 38327]|uniref:Uncharacterized protein n=1 Tax=Allomyces macrogynus (strain ATCC 38327) TaxID=578462 RepID=A0A0L0SCF1_ALLM3|nr:hypothetical protein AMAG_18492 [Allomyces macrogynus ATCC 38327]|eukprot:KNE60228.1 hypothetical protein AMAG_18492 [Allomyces macrogynus ATCC 38327]